MALPNWSRVAVALAAGLVGSMTGRTLWAQIPPQGRLDAFYTFDGSGPKHPFGSLLLGSDGNLYGQTSDNHGLDATGTIFRVTPQGTFRVLHEFSCAVTCMGRALIEARDGDLYGIGGIRTAAPEFIHSSIFRVTKTGTLTLIHDFPGFLVNSFLQARDDNFYGTARTTDNRGGMVFRIDPKGTTTILHSFAAYREVPTSLTESADGVLYGTVPEGGPSGLGRILKLSREGIPETVHDFNGRDGVRPESGLVLSRDGNFYGTTAGGDIGGAAFAEATVFRLTLSGVLETVWQFPLVGGSISLIAGQDGGLYGVVDGDAAPVAGMNRRRPTATIFRLTPGSQPAVLYSFDTSPDETRPQGPLVQGRDSALYGIMNTDATGKAAIFRVPVR